ncbi:hypothetical protein H632_c112p1 [Helicosporidium sp. ATCC 50920]|nr:hypothetical protein H632_c112p1 [Helicosporidium sp. ATCC 50920]|eukprot:KDD76768.1 hypothetical protein H632_c112p1 [Helicosporidium sp. ATCC 50920]
MDALTGVDSESESSSSGSEEEAVRPGSKPAPKNISLETLKQHGYSGGPSVLFTPEPQDDQDNQWNWSTGAEHKASELAEEAEETRAANVRAATTAAAEAAQHSLRVVAHAAQLREEKKAEDAQRKLAKNQTWKAKEKRKREQGQQTSSKNYVEEEKRRAREFGVVSGFDT